MVWFRIEAADYLGGLVGQVSRGATVLDDGLRADIGFLEKVFDDFALGD